MFCMPAVRVVVLLVLLLLCVHKSPDGGDGDGAKKGVWERNAFNTLHGEMPVGSHHRPLTTSQAWLSHAPLQIFRCRVLSRSMHLSLQ